MSKSQEAANVEEVANLENSPEFEALVFAGGGAKGVVYSGVVDSLHKNKLLPGVKYISGTSAGSICAALTATAMSPERFAQVSAETDYEKLTGAGFLIQKDGKPLYELMADLIRENVITNLEDFDFSAVDAKKANDAKEVLQKAKDKKPITFGDIAKLRAIMPEKFKDLYVTAVCSETNELEIFNADNTPNVEIALACRASSSIPGYFQPVKINDKTYIDGGCIDNVPSKHFVDKSSESKPDKSKVLSFVFGNKLSSKMNMAIYSSKEKITNPSALKKFVVNVIFSVIAKFKKPIDYLQEVENTAQEVRSNGLRTVVLHTGEIGTLSFKNATTQSRLMHLKGSVQTDMYLDNHDIAPQNHELLEMRSFMIDVVNDALKQSFIEKIASALGWQNSSKEQQCAKLLNYCEPNAFGADQREVAAASFCKNYKDTGSLLKMLNDPACNLEVKACFARAARVDFQNDKRIDPNLRLDKNMREFKFAKDDIDRIRHGQSVLKIKEENRRQIAGVRKCNSIPKRIAPSQSKINVATKSQSPQR